MEAAIGTAEVGRGRAREGKYAREATTDPTFSLPGHVAKTLAVAAGIFALGAALARDAAWTAWLAVPVFWVVANFFEYFMHRVVMHKPLWPKMMYVAHAKVHHNAFAGPDQEIASVAELSVVMMPWYTLVIVFAMAAPIALAAAAIGGPALAGVFLVSAVAYFLIYETIHTLHHVPSDWLAARRWGRSRALAWLRRHHHHHHQLERMTTANFNVTVPLADAVLGTLVRPASSLPSVRRRG